MSIDYKKIAEDNNVTEDQVKALEKEFKRFLQNSILKSVSEGRLIKVQMRGFGTLQVHERSLTHRIYRYLSKFREHKKNNAEYPQEEVQRFRLLWNYRHEKLEQYFKDNRRNNKRNSLLKTI